MANYINKYTNIEAYNADDGKQYPNVSYLIDVDIIKWVKENPYIVVCKYNVTSTESATKLLGSSTGITYQIIDDVKQDTVKATYTFDTLGEHTVKYKFDGTSIASNAFGSCTGLTSITIPNSVTSIGYWAFYNCTSLTSVTIPNSVTEIGDNAFRDCSGLTSVTIPDSVTSISDSAFINCTGLTKVEISDIAAWCKISFYNFFANPLYNAKHLYLNGKEVTNLVIPNSVTSIGKYAFSSCIGLTSVTIPNSVTKIGIGTFSKCSGLTSITIEATTPPTLATNAFYSTNDCPIYVPAESVDAYKAATNWSSLADRISAIVA